MSEKIFVNGFIFKLPRDGAPEFVKGTINIKIHDFAKFVKQHQEGEWMNIDLKVSREGKAYAELNTYKRSQDVDIPDNNSNLPF